MLTWYVIVFTFWDFFMEKCNEFDSESETKS